MGSPLQSSVFVHAFLLAMLLAWLAGSIAMVVSDARETRRQAGQTVRESAPPALSPADGGHPDATRHR
jgi:hypothetical protein